MKPEQHDHPKYLRSQVTTTYPLLFCRYWPILLLSQLHLRQSGQQLL